MLFDPPEKVYRDRNNEPKGEHKSTHTIRGSGKDCETGNNIWTFAVLRKTQQA